jgi:hypothetical protein
MLPQWRVNQEVRLRDGMPAPTALPAAAEAAAQ